LVKPKSKKKQVVVKTKKIVLIVSLSVLLVVVGVVAFYGIKAVLNYQKEDSNIATVNGEPISVKEFDLIYQNQIRSNVIKEFTSKGIDTNSKNFWKSSFNGQIPQNVAKEETLNSAVKIKLQYILAKENGVVPDISYGALLKSLVDENNRRQVAVKNNEVIYGPVQYDTYGYYNYIYSNMITKLKDKLWKNKFKVDDDTLMKYYEANKDKNYKQANSLNVDRIFITLSDGKTPVNPAQRDKGIKILEGVKVALDKGEDLKTATASVNASDGIKVEYKNMDLNQLAQSSESKHGGSIFSEAQKLSEGQISNVFETRSPLDFSADESSSLDTINILKCLKTTGTGYMKFEEAKDNVRNQYVSEKYNLLLDDLIKSAKIDQNKSVYDWYKVN